MDNSLDFVAQEDKIETLGPPSEMTNAPTPYTQRCGSQEWRF